MKKVILLVLFVSLATSAWSQDLRALAYRAFNYLGSPVPEKANIDGNVGRLDDKIQGDYQEQWGFELYENKRVRTAHYFVYDSNRNNVDRILSDIKLQVNIQGYKFLSADGDMTAYITNDGPFSMAIIIGNSIKISKSGRFYIQVSFARLADL